MDYIQRQKQATEQGLVKIGDYIVIQRQDQTKLHKVSLEYVTLGKDKIDFNIIIGKPVWKTYKMIPKRYTKREYYLIECPNSEYVNKEFIKNISSLQDDGKSENFENFKTHQNISNVQKKFLKKRDKKFSDDRRYFEYVTVRWPTIRLISEIMHRYDSGKIMGLRSDTLSQILTAVSLNPSGTYIIYENRCAGLVVAALLNNLTEGGRLIHVHPSNFAENFAVNAMNFRSEQMSRITYSNVNNLLMKLEQKRSEHSENKSNDSEVVKIPLQEEKAQDEKSIATETAQSAQSSKSELDKKDDNSNPKKRKYTDDDDFAVKKAKWNMEADKATNILWSSKADGLILIAREHPGNILNALLPYVAASRPFAVFCSCLEPLLEVYVQLKSTNNTIGLRVTETFLRKQQIKPNGTHPDISMSGMGGYLLSGLVVDSELTKSVAE